MGEGGEAASASGVCIRNADTIQTFTTGKSSRNACKSHTP